MLVAAQVLLRVFRFCPTRQAPTSSLQTCHAAVLSRVHGYPDGFTKNRRLRLGNCCSEARQRESSCRLVRGTAKDPTAVSCPKCGPSPASLPPTLTSVACFIYCAQHLSQRPACSFHGSHGRVTFHWRTLHQSSMLASRLHFTEAEGTIPAKKNYRCKSLINSKTISVGKNTELFVQDLLIPKT